MPQVIVGCAMKLRRSRLSGQSKLAASAAAIFGRIIGYQQLHFGNGIDAGRNVSGVQVSGILAGGAIHVEDHLSGLAAVDARYASARPTPIVQRLQSLDAGQRHDEREWIPAAGRGVLNLAEADVDRAVGAVGGHVHGRGMNFNRAGYFADLQLDLMQVHPFLGGDVDRPLIVSFETRVRDANTVIAWHKTTKDESAV